MHNDKFNLYVYVKKSAVSLCKTNNAQFVKHFIKLSYALKTHLKPVLDVFISQRTFYQALSENASSEIFVQCAQDMWE